MSDVSFAVVAPSDDSDDVHVPFSCTADDLWPSVEIVSLALAEFSYYGVFVI
jgi:hypothetical protein